MLVAGILLFTLASVACAVAPSLGVLLAARAGQGIGAALLMPNSLAILGNAFSGEARGRAIGTWASVGAIASAVGPPLGGWLVGVAGWQAIFLINVPVAGAAIWITLRHVEDSATGRQPLDWAGAALATAALGGLTWSLTMWSSAPAVTGTTWGVLGAGIAALLLFVLVEHRRGEAAMMPLALFGSKAFVGLTLLTLLLYGALGGLLVLLPYVLITGGGYTALQAGLALLPFSVVIGTASRLMGRVAATLGPRLPLTIGPLVTAVGFALLVRVEPGASYWSSVFPGVAVIALGMAGAVAPLTTAILGSVDADHTGAASGFNSAVARTGGLVATALAGAVIAATGAALIPAFQAAAWIGAALAAGSGLIALATLGGSASAQEKVQHRP